MKRHLRRRVRENLKKRVGEEKVVAFFRSPADLRAHVISSLSIHRERKETEFHYVSDIPKPPEIYIAHPYTLLQTRDLIGRQNELNLIRQANRADRFRLQASARAETHRKAGGLTAQAHSML